LGHENSFSAKRYEEAETSGKPVVTPKWNPFAADREDRVLEVCSEVVIEAFAKAEKKRMAFWDLLYTKYDKSKFGGLKYDQDKNELSGVPIAEPKQPTA
jgi:hypothetical protein